jgi:hypothetical protein
MKVMSASGLKLGSIDFDDGVCPGYHPCHCSGRDRRSCRMHQAFVHHGRDDAGLLSFVPALPQRLARDGPAQKAPASTHERGRRSRRGRGGSGEGNNLICACYQEETVAHATLPVLGLSPYKTPFYPMDDTRPAATIGGSPPIPELQSRCSAAGDSVAPTAMMPVRQGTKTVVPTAALPPSMSSPHPEARDASWPPMPPKSEPLSR